jgi:hypothetical protein
VGALPLTVFNLDYMISSFQSAINHTRLRIVALKYRALGDLDWEDTLSFDDEGNLKQDANDEAVKIDFSSDEDKFGYAKANWQYVYHQLADGTYELLAETSCETLDGAPAEFNSFSDVPLDVKIDRFAPKLYGIPLPKNGNPLWPGDEVVFAFDEPIQCLKPYRFGLSVTVKSVIDGATNKASEFGKDDLHVVCERNEIRFAFDYTNVGLDTLMGNSITAVLTRVKDLVGNPYTNGVSDEIVHVFLHGTVNETEAEVLFYIVLNRDCTTDHGELRREIAEFMYLKDQYRIQIQSAPACSTDGTKVFVTYKVVSSTRYGSSDQRLASTDMDLAPAPHVARRLIDSLSDESPMRVRQIDIIIGESDQRRRAEDLIKQKADLDISGATENTTFRFVFAKLSSIEQKLEEDRLKQEEDREMLKSVMQMLQQKQSSSMKQEEAPPNSVLFPMLTCLLGVVAACLVMWTVGKGQKENKQDVEASIL